MNNDKIMGAVVALAVIVALGSAVFLISNGADTGDANEASELVGIPGSEESTVGNSLLQTTPDYVKALAAGVIILCAALIVRRELN